MFRKYAISEGKIIEAPNGDASILLYINPDETERKYLVDTFKIDSHNLQSSFDPHELARMELEENHAVLIVKRPKRYSAQDNFLFKVESLGLFVFSSKLVILMSEDIPLFESRYFSKVTSVQDIALKLINRSTFHFQEHLKVINMCSDQLEREINASVNNRQLLNMFTLEKSLVYYLEAISSNGHVIDKLKLSAAKLGFSPTDVELLDDIAIENAQCYEMAQIYSQVLSGLMDARASLISNNLNVLMKNLNALVIAVAVPSFFAAVGGMSEFTGVVKFEHWKIAYTMFVMAMIATGAVTFYVIKKLERFWK
jgi:magnesium transporter